ncbi:MAG: Gfo/Idh/MocA family oxidoreductase [Clostridia bacterium]|nr:Gfo/Idh/MocA family oxidoreductase [Clostridia bacterium]
MENKQKKKVILIGAGSRGNAYARIGGQIELFDTVAIAEPIKARREFVVKRHGIKEENIYESWEPLIARGKIADAAIIATMDRDHFAPTMAAIEAGYDILLEKPVSPLPEECRAIEEAAKKKGVKVLICHVLRYTPFFRALKNVIKEGYVGDVVNIQHTEGVGNVHQSHSFVRGNWGNSERSSFMLLQKSCHDMDILQWLIGKECKKVQSFGSLTYFKKENAPEGAPEYCIDGCPVADSCPYNAVKLYLKSDSDWFRCASTQKFDPTDEDVERAIRTTNYGKCVFKCDNDVVDHQVVNLEFEDGIICSFTMSAFNKGGREIRIMGTKGEIIANAGKPTFTYKSFASDEAQEISIEDQICNDTITGGHGGGDTGIMYAFYDMLSGKVDPELSNIEISVKNHMIAFAAEKSRLEGRVVSLDEFEEA